MSRYSEGSIALLVNEASRRGLPVPDCLSPYLETATGTAAEILAASDAERYDWSVHARPSQLAPPGEWRHCLIMAGRGWGKSRAGAEWVRAKVEAGEARRVALAAPTAADAREVMVEGHSGLLSVSPPWFRPHYEPSRRRLTWPNGAIATTYSADEPDRLRGPNHDLAWCDEVATWRFPESFDQLLLGLRLGDDPRCLVTTTPKPVRLIRELIALSTTVVIRGTTYENRANLAPAFFEQIIRKYEGTRLGRQELNAELLEDNPFALWQRDRIEALRVAGAPPLSRIVVGVDPQAGEGEDAAETGIVVAGRAENGHGYVLDDRTISASPLVWANAAIAAYHTHRADRIIAEANQGGAMVESTLRTVERGAPVRLVHASRGKQVRAEPISALYEQGRVHHVGTFSELEDQLCEWVPGETSPDRLDALVWALTELFPERRLTGLPIE